MSLMFALQSLAHDTGYAIDHDDLNAALGLSWMTTAVPDEDDLARWQMYARDAFVIPAGRLFGMTIRDIHPPEAARGLNGLPEFAQHFDASYRPLVVRALEHDQSVLAWQGWPGDQAMMWGIITTTCDEGIGLAGRVPWPTAARTCEAEHESHVPSPSAQACRQYDTVILDRPPVQLYVVETITPTQPDRDELLDIVLAHAGQILDNALMKHFSVLAGPAAYDAWIASVRDEQASGADYSDLVEGHRQMGTSVLAGHRSAIRFLERQLTLTMAIKRSLIETLMDKCQIIVTSISHSLDAAANDAWTSTAAGRTKVVDPITRARVAANEMLTALESQARGS